jgi:cell division protein FtsW
VAQRIRTDWILFFTIVALVCFGLVMVYSASSIMADVRYHSSWYFIARQLGWAVVSFLVLMYCKRFDYRRLNHPTFAFVPLGLVTTLLVLVYFLDSRRHRWLNLGFASLQPSELAKPALILFLAWFISTRVRAINDKHTLGPAGLILGVLGVTVVAADLGTAMVLVGTAAAVLYVAGIDRRYLFAGAALVAVAGGFAILAKPYRVARIVGKLDPDYSIISKFDKEGRIKSYVQRSLSSTDPSYQPRQSKIAVGAGGVFGLGLMQSRQKLMYLPEAQTDYIYAVIGEELGLWGSAAVLAGFFVILWRGLRVYFLAPDPFGRYLAFGVTVSIFIQALMHMSVVLDIGPVKGIPLPMISYGGSSLLSTLTSLGMLLSVSEHAG